MFLQDQSIFLYLYLSCSQHHLGIVHLAYDIDSAMGSFLSFGSWSHTPWFYNTPHKFWDQSPSSHFQYCLQVSETVTWHRLWCCYSANILQDWVEWRGLIYFCKVNHYRISRIFSRNWLGLNNLCEILSQNLRKLGK